MNIVKVQVTQRDYEVNEYGLPECEPMSIKVTVIRLMRAVTQQRLGEVKVDSETRFGDVKGDIKGRVTMTVIADDAALGRLYKLVHWYQNDWDHAPDVRVLSIEDLGDTAIIVGVVA
jgi:hypothetical protein